MCDFVNFLKNIDLNGYTLIVPSVSVGNVGQLTIDLLITTYNFKKVATFWHPGIIPTVGADPFDDDNSELCTACELYANEDLKIATLQLRSSIEFNLALSFFREFKAFVTSSKFGRIFILTSSFAHLLNDPTAIYYYLSNDGNQTILEQMEFKLLKPTFNERYIVEGSGYGVKLYEILKESAQCTLLVKYVSEGDNRNDAVTMLSKLQNLITSLKSDKSPLRCPNSWNFVFGNSCPITIF